MRNIFLVLFSFLAILSLDCGSVIAQSNTVYGVAACNSLTTEGGNSCFGYEAGATTTTGVSNSFFGRGAGVYSVGSGNSFFGYGTGANNTAGGFNTFLGRSAGSYNQTGNSNTFVGWNAGLNIDTGSQNSSLGANSTFKWGFMTYATVIGAEAQALASNSITLGRRYGEDMVRIPGLLELRTLGVSGTIPLCRNVFNAIAVCSSSMRYKSNIHSFSLGLDLIRRLRPVSFNWKEGGVLDLGLVAEEVNRIEPLLTTTNSNGQIEGVKYDRVGVVLINAIKEQQIEIESLHETNANLRRETVELRNGMKLQQEDIKAVKAIACSIRPKAAVCRPSN